MEGLDNSKAFTDWGGGGRERGTQPQVYVSKDTVWGFEKALKNYIVGCLDRRV
jgi:hypothetical protein